MILDNIQFLERFLQWISISTDHSHHNDRWFWSKTQWIFANLIDDPIFPDFIQIIEELVKMPIQEPTLVQERKENRTATDPWVNERIGRVNGTEEHDLPSNGKTCAHRPKERTKKRTATDRRWRERKGRANRGQRTRSTLRWEDFPIQDISTYPHFSRATPIVR
jgi:hypothetical protein